MLILIYVLLLGTVSACGPNCTACNTLFCTACAPSTELTISGQCTSSILLPHCSVLFSNTLCSQCKPTYLLSFSSTCEKDYSGCLQQDLFTGECTSCSFGMYLQQGQCKGKLNCGKYAEGQCVECKKQYTLDGGICIYASKNCVEVDNKTGTCLKCGEGYQLVGYQCLPKSLKVPNCYIYNINGQCAICKVGYDLNANAQCLLPPDQKCVRYDLLNQCLQCKNPQFTIQNGRCIDPHCLQTNSSNNQCLKCKQNFSVKPFSSICTIQDPNCLNYTADGLFCNQCTAGFFVNSLRTCTQLPDNCQAADMVKLTCISCKNGYSLTAGVCRANKVIDNCQLVNTFRTACVLCKHGFYLVEGSCKQVSSLCNGYDPTYGICLACKVGYINYGGQCRDPQCQTQQGDLCLRCKPSFKVHHSGLCYFSDQNCISATTKACLLCKSGFYLHIGMCKALPANCIQVGDNGVCSICRQGYQVWSGLCVTPELGCVGYQMLSENVSTCTGCQVGFNLVNGTCQILAQSDPNCISVRNGICVLCSNRYFFNGSTCTPVNPQCKSYEMSSGMCTSCYPGYMLFNGTCPPAPPKDPNCKVITPQGCTQCYQSYYLNNEAKCIQINPLCKSSNSTTGLCLSCFKGYSLRNGQCSQAFADPNCAKYDQQGGCLVCSDKYYKMAGVCTRVSALCKTYNPQTGSCLTCYPGYYLAGGACWTGDDPNLDPNCNLRSITGGCLQCQASYYLGDNGYCKAANPLCRTFNTSTGNCLTCYKGYTIRETTCALATSDTTDPNCLTFLPSGLCQECYASFYPSAGICKQVNTLCRTANYTDGTCLTCYPGYTLTKGTCIIPKIYSQQAQDPYCLTFNQEGKCSKCRQGYYASNGVCGQVDPQCKIFDHSQGKCTECYQGYTLSVNGCGLQAQAVIPFCQNLDQLGNCQKCLQGYYRQTPKKCTAVSTLCFTYDQNTGACTSCRSGYFMQDGRCVYPAMGIDSNCIGYDTSAFCKECKPGYALVNYRCAMVDPNCERFNAVQNVCEKCGSGLMAQGRNCV